MQHHDLSDVRGHTNDDAIKAFNLSHEEPRMSRSDWAQKARKFAINAIFRNKSPPLDSVSLNLHVSVEVI